MPGELYQIYENKTAINEKRTAIKGSGFDDNDYLSSREYSSDRECCVYLGSGDIRNDYKGYTNYVLGFLALEY